jgi:competence transcription factor ComK
MYNLRGCRDGADEGDAQDSGENEENKNVKINKVTTYVPCQSVMCLMTIVFRNVKNTGTSRLEAENRTCTYMLHSLVLHILHSTQHISNSICHSKNRTAELSGIGRNPPNMHSRKSRQYNTAVVTFDN